jgi:hypothetical protein
MLFGGDENESELNQSAEIQETDAPVSYKHCKFKFCNLENKNGL